MIILPNDLTTQEIRVLQEYRRVKTETLTIDQIKAIKHPSGGGEGPAGGLASKGYLSADAGSFILTDLARAFLAVDPKPMFEDGGAASGGDEIDLAEA